MSVRVALDNVFLRPAARWGHTEYSLEYHRNYLSARIEASPDSPDLAANAYDAFAYDLLWCTNDGLVDWASAGRTTDMGHAAYAADGSDQREPRPSPFRSEKEVWAFDAVAEYGLPDADAQVTAYEEVILSARSRHPHQVLTGGCYRTLISGAIESFGWEMLLLAASDPGRMETVLESFFQRTLFFMEAWARTSAEVLIQHDDFVWTSGPFLDPGFYRDVIIPRYAALWKPVHAAGKKVLFCSDGNFMEFADDILDAGADGLIFEPCNDFATMAERYGGSACLVGSCVDCRDLAAGNWPKVCAALDRTFDALDGCRGAIVAVGNHLPPNIPGEMLDRYFARLLPRLAHR